MNTAFDSVSGAFEDKYQKLTERQATELKFVDIAYLEDIDALRIRIQNVGSTTLETNETELLVNGLLTSGATMTIDGLVSGLWLPTNTLTITLSGPDIKFSPSVMPRMYASNDARLTAPTNMSVGDDVFIIDGPAIDVFTLEGAYNRSISDSTHLLAPRDIESTGGYLYVLDNSTHVDRYTYEGVWVDEFINDSVNCPDPTSIAADQTYIYLVDSGNHVDRYDRSTGAFVDQLIPNGVTMSSPIDLTIGTHIFVTDYSGGAYHIDRYALDGTGGTQIVSSPMISGPTDISASGPGLADEFIYVANNSREVTVFDGSGGYVGTVSDGLSDAVHGVDSTGKIYVSDGVNGLVVENLGSSIKVVAQNGVSKIATL